LQKTFRWRYKDELAIIWGNNRCWVWQLWRVFWMLKWVVQVCSNERAAEGYSRIWNCSLVQQYLTL